MSDHESMGTSQSPAGEESLAELLRAARAENADAVWRWLQRVGNWEAREREALQTRPDMPHLRRILIGGREAGVWWWLSAVCSLPREWTATDLGQIPGHIWAWDGLDGKLPEMIYDATADRLLWCDPAARIDACEEHEFWLDQLEREVRRSGE